MAHARSWYMIPMMQYGYMVIFGKICFFFLICITTRCIHISCIQWCGYQYKFCKPVESIGASNSIPVTIPLYFTDLLLVGSLLTLLFRITYLLLCISSTCVITIFVKSTNWILGDEVHTIPESQLALQTFFNTIYHWARSFSIKGNKLAEWFTNNFD